MNNKEWADLISKKRDELTKFINNLAFGVFGSTDNFKVILDENGKIYSEPEKATLQEVKEGRAIEVCTMKFDFDFDESVTLNDYVLFMKEIGLEYEYKDFIHNATFEFLKNHKKMKVFRKWVVSKYVEDYIHKVFNAAIDYVYEALNKYRGNDV